MPKGLSERIQAMMARGESADSLLNFWEKLQLNPSWRAVEQLWPFLDRAHIPLTKDGCFLAYKGVNTDYTDKHSGKIDNHPGVVNSMPRNQISDDPNVACHYGFHVGAVGYATSFGPRTVVCKVDPADVVCIPYDSGQQKIRVCRYRVVGNHGEPLPSTLLDESLVNVPVDVPEVEGTVVEEKATVTRKNEKDEHVKQQITAKHVHKKVPENESEKVAAKEYEKYDKMNARQLLDVNLMDLRKYATYGLKIVGASKIAGGKTPLVEKIVKVRKKG